MGLDKKTVKIIALLSGGLILFAWVLNNAAEVLRLFSLLLGTLAPFVIGLALAFALNVPMRALETHLFARMKAKGVRGARAARMLSFVLTLVLLVLGIAVVSLIVIPEMGNTFVLLGKQLPAFFKNLQVQGEQLAKHLPELESLVSSLNLDWGSIGNSLVGFLRNGATSVLGSTMQVATSVFSGAFNFFIGFIFATYILLDKEKLGVQTRRVLYSWLPVARADRLLYIASLTERTFSRFLTGQCLEAFILGTMFFVSMLILRLPYAMLIAVVVALTALIPMFGAYIGLAIGAFLILVVNPMQALWFLILFLVLQQIENNLIYPRVVGGSVGLPAMWVMVAVTIGGSLMGVAGMLLMVPAASVVYALARENTQHRLLRRKVPADRYGQHTEEPK